MKTYLCSLIPNTIYETGQDMEWFYKNLDAYPKNRLVFK